MQDTVRETAYAQALDQIGAEALAELRKLYEIFDEKIYLWMTGLWDKEAGAFYYSESARDTNLYRPDIESTAQVLRFLNTSGISSGSGTFQRVSGNDGAFNEFLLYREYD